MANERRGWLNTRRPTFLNESETRNQVMFRYNNGHVATEIA